MASTSRWLLTILKLIGWLVGAGFLLFVVASLFWWWAWTNTGEMNRERINYQTDTANTRLHRPTRREKAEGPAADTLGKPAG